MEESKKKTVWDRAMGWILASIVGMAFWSLAVHLTDRFVGNDKAWHFYTPSTDMTCVVMRNKGKDSMACLPGDLRVDKEASHD